MIDDHPLWKNVHDPYDTIVANRVTYTSKGPLLLPDMSLLSTFLSILNSFDTNSDFYFEHSFVLLLKKCSWYGITTYLIGVIHISSRSMLVLAHNENNIFKKQVMMIYEIYIHKALLLVNTFEIQATQLWTLDFGSMIC